MKNSIAILGLVLTMALPVSAATPFDGKLIALDAGHGNGETGAVGDCNGTPVIEADVNWAVRLELEKLLPVGTYHEVAQLDSRQDRVANAEAAGSTVLISIHHNGSTNTSADYTQSFVTQKNDKIFASYIHPAIVNALNLPNKGIKNDGYGMTVYGSLHGVLTESYFVTNTDGACDFIDYQNGATNTRVQKEAQAMYDGLYQYFSQNTGGGGKGRNQ
ncbi:MAG: N-acetylmuramoyl-L-alanine amidase [Candidatus Kaiserbacteria bacterium]|nr:MAG: N-acetylmuramoyl-L-alanine amidase [Candidatus Kaiserbacteria bacterium]